MLNFIFHFQPLAGVINPSPQNFKRFLHVLGGSLRFPLLILSILLVDINSSSSGSLIYHADLPLSFYQGCQFSSDPWKSADFEVARTTFINNVNLFLISIDHRSLINDVSRRTRHFFNCIMTMFQHSSTSF
jgi:hypothetical protein